MFYTAVFHLKGWGQPPTLLNTHISYLLVPCTKLTASLCKKIWHAKQYRGNVHTLITLLDRSVSLSQSVTLEVEVSMMCIVHCNIRLLLCGQLDHTIIKIAVTERLHFCFWHHFRVSSFPDINLSICLYIYIN